MDVGISGARLGRPTSTEHLADKLTIYIFMPSICGNVISIGQVGCVEGNVLWK